MDAHKPRTSDVPATPASRGRFAMAGTARLDAVMMWLVTIGYLAILLPVATPIDSRLLALPLHELGDFLAGAFAPLAFAWLVYGYLLQRHELEMQRKELAGQREELSMLVAAQRSSAAATARLAELQAKAINATERSYRMQVAPRIVVQPSGHEVVTGSIVRQRFQVENYGHPAFDMQLVCESAEWTSNLGSELRNMSVSGSLTVEFTGADIALPVRFFVRYRDAGGTTWRHSFLAVAGRVQPSEPVFHDPNG